MHQKCRETGEQSGETAAIEGWRQKAAQCRRLALSVTDRQTSEALIRLAEEYEREVARATSGDQTRRD